MAFVHTGLSQAVENFLRVRQVTSEGTSSHNRGPFYWHRLSRHGYVITSIKKGELKLLIHSQTSTTVPLKFGNGSTIHISLYWVCDYLSTSRLELIHGSYRGLMVEMCLLKCLRFTVWNVYLWLLTFITEINVIITFNHNSNSHRYTVNVSCGNICSKTGSNLAIHDARLLIIIVIQFMSPGFIWKLPWPVSSDGSRGSNQPTW